MSNNNKELSFLILSFDARKDTLYHYDTEKNQLIPQFTIDFKNKAVNLHAYTELPNYYFGDFTEPQKIDAYHTATINHKFYVIEKTTLKGAYFKLENDFLGGIEIEWPIYTFSNGYYTANYEPANLLEKLENTLLNRNISAEMREKLTDLKNSIKETDNNYILYAKLK